MHARLDRVSLLIAALGVGCSAQGDEGTSSLSAASQGDGETGASDGAGTSGGAATSGNDSAGATSVGEGSNTSADAGADSGSDTGVQPEACEDPLVEVEHSSEPVTASVETEPVPHSGDAADDPAVWIHPADPALSVIIGTDKQGGLVVYGLDGSELQYRGDGNMNNVDIRYGFTLGGESVDVVTAGNRSNDSIAVYVLDPESRELRDVAAGELSVGFTVYGSCMYQSASTGKVYAFVNSQSGAVEQWELLDDGNGRVEAILARSISVESQTEGCVADDELGFFYLGEESRGIWKFGAEPDDGEEGTLIDATGNDGNLVADVEGLAIYYGRDGSGYLIASSQGSNDYVVYERGGDNGYVTRFSVQDGSVDGTNDTDGIDVTSANLGPVFPFGAFIVQDGSNSGGNQNFKLVPWERVAASAEPPLVIDTCYDPRSAGT